jgi:hypothetical protein
MYTMFLLSSLNFLILIMYARRQDTVSPFSITMALFTFTSEAEFFKKNVKFGSFKMQKVVGRRKLRVVFHS